MDEDEDHMEIMGYCSWPLYIIYDTHGLGMYLGGFHGSAGVYSFPAFRYMACCFASSKGFSMGPQYGRLPSLRGLEVLAPGFGTWLTFFLQGRGVDKDSEFVTQSAWV